MSRIVMATARLAREGLTRGQVALVRGPLALTRGPLVPARSLGTSPGLGAEWYTVTYHVAGSGENHTVQVGEGTSM